MRCQAQVPAGTGAPLARAPEHAHHGEREHGQHMQCAGIGVPNEKPAEAFMQCQKRWYRKSFAATLATPSAPIRSRNISKSTYVFIAEPKCRCDLIRFSRRIIMIDIMLRSCSPPPRLALLR